MNERRRFRRSSPDAPQGFAVVACVFAGLIAVVVLAGLGFRGSDGADSAADPADRVTTPGEAGPDGQTTVVPSTVLIRGATTTTFFVTTTTPITTTTSTTTTTLAGPAIDPGDIVVEFTGIERSVSFTVRSSSPEGVEFTVVDLPEGISASPSKATVSQSTPVTITLRITDPTTARSGSFALLGADGTRVSVRVVVPGSEIAIAGVSFDPNPPVCGTPARLIVLVTGSDVAGVSANVSAGAGATTVTLLRDSSGAWTGVLPNGATGSTLSGAISVAGPDGEVVAQAFSTTVTGDPGCGP